MIDMAAEEIQVKNGYPKLVINIDRDEDGTEYAWVESLEISPGVKIPFHGMHHGSVYCKMTDEGLVCKTEISPPVTVKYARFNRCSEVYVHKDGRIQAYLPLGGGCEIFRENKGKNYAILCTNNLWKWNPKSLLPFDLQLALENVKFEVEKEEEKTILGKKLKTVVYRAVPKQ